MQTHYKPLVYLAGPYTAGDVAINVRSQLQLFVDLMEEGTVTPFAPLASHLTHLIFPQPYRKWLEHDREIILYCDAVLIADAEYPIMSYKQNTSLGTEIEINHAREHGIPVFYSIKELYDWTKDVFNNYPD